MIDGTTTLTESLPLVLVNLPSGNHAALVYSMTFGELVVCLLLALLLALTVVQMWRTRRG